MKKSLSMVLALLFTLSAFAQAPPAVKIKAQDTALIATPTIQCGMCEQKIMTYLDRYDGIISVKVNVKKKTTLVKFLPDRINKEEIKAAIANAGYDANNNTGDVAANEKSYRRLPKCCKKPEDGGGMNKN
jgi:copper chaperone CopZ